MHVYSAHVFGWHTTNFFNTQPETHNKAVLNCQEDKWPQKSYVRFNQVVIYLRRYCSVDEVGVVLL